jgi:TonB family protein
VAGPPGLSAPGGAAGPAAPEAVEDYARLVPRYSDDAIDSDVAGTVSLRLEIDETGRVTRAAVLKGLGYGLDEVAIETARRYRFHPARDAAGRAVPAVLGWRIVWESYWKRLVVQTVAGAPNCRGRGPMNLGETHPVYRDCDGPAGAFELSPGQAP